MKTIKVPIYLYFVFTSHTTTKPYSQNQNYTQNPITLSHTAKTYMRDHDNVANLSTKSTILI